MDERRDITLIAGKPAHYKVRRSRRARNLTLHIDKRDGLVVVLPQRVPLREVGPLLAEHAAWIDRQLEKHGVRFGPIRRTYATGSEILVLGRPRRLSIGPVGNVRARSRVRLDGDVLEACLSPPEILDPRPALERWLRRAARAVILQRVQRIAEIVELQPRRIYIGERKSRWGSCSQSGNLSFCYRLVMASLPVIDAVIAHELCHLRHMNHGYRFYRLLILACPDHQERMEWLRRHEDDLRL
jgi:predicted metal-dependent hydrolase